MTTTSPPDPTTPGARPATLQAYEAADGPLRALLDAVPVGAWDAASPCEGWSAADVVRHLVDTQRDFCAEHGVDLGDAPDVAGAPAASWRAHADGVRAALADPAVPAVAFDGFFGPTTVGATLERFYVWDMLVHRWDVARAVGADAAGVLTDAELDRVERGADGFGDALHTDGVCRPGVQVPPGASRGTRVLARLGRVA